VKAQHIAGLDGPHQLKAGQWTLYNDIIYARCPNGVLASLELHTLKTEFDTDGTPMLSVVPSIECDDGAGGRRFHGFIELGIWLDENRQPVPSAHSAEVKP
jgi:hypothetical protein